jgi:hypothetical protein
MDNHIQENLLYIACKSQPFGYSAKKPSVTAGGIGYENFLCLVNFFLIQMLQVSTVLELLIAWNSFSTVAVKALSSR